MNAVIVDIEVRTRGLGLAVAIIRAAMLVARVLRWRDPVPALATLLRRLVVVEWRPTTATRWRPVEYRLVRKALDS